MDTCFFVEAVKPLKGLPPFLLKNREHMQSQRERQLGVGNFGSKKILPNPYTAE